MAKSKAEAMAERYYPRYWSKDRLRALVAAGRLTKAAYRRVTGEDYREEP